MLEKRDELAAQQGSRFRHLLVLLWTVLILGLGVLLIEQEVFVALPAAQGIDAASVSEPAFAEPAEVF